MKLMRVADKWKDYELMDASGGERLERWGDILLIRPDPQIIWNTLKVHPSWQRANARYVRSSSGGGKWENYSLSKTQWLIRYNELTFKISPTGFKHTGLFPEQAVNWQFLEQKIAHANGRLKVLNLFAYTGGATLACAKAGAEVCHVDASKGMVSWAKENARLSHLEASPVRWIVDDCKKFVEREIRRGNLYDGVIMDPPSYGRGPGGEVWKLEDQIYDLLGLASRVLNENACFFMLNSYTSGFAPSTMKYLLQSVLAGRRRGKFWASEIGLPVTASGLALPCGATAVWESE